MPDRRVSESKTESSSSASAMPSASSMPPNPAPPTRPSPRKPIPRGNWAFQKECSCPKRIPPCTPLPLLLCILATALCFSACGTTFPNQRPYQPGLASERYNAALLQAAQVQELKAPAQEPYVYRIHPTDIIEVTVFDYEKMNTATRVGVDGKINFPPLGEIQAAGLTQRELETAIADGLRGAYLQNPKIMVSVKEAVSQNITILGEVRSPGQQAVWGEIRLVDALAKAGGVNPAASSIAYLVRGFPQVRGYAQAAEGQTTATSSAAPETGSHGPSEQGLPASAMPISLAGLLQRGEKEWNIPLQPGDILTVPPAGSVFATGPGFVKPGTYPLTFAPKTIRELIDEAGGLTWAAKRSIILARTGLDGKTEYYEVDYKKTLEQDGYDGPVQQGDRLIAVNSGWRRTLDVFRRGLLSATATFAPSPETNIGLGTNALFVK